MRVHVHVCRGGGGGDPRHAPIISCGSLHDITPAVYDVIYQLALTICQHDIVHGFSKRARLLSRLRVYSTAYRNSLLCCYSDMHADLRIAFL